MVHSENYMHYFEGIRDEGGILASLPSANRPGCTAVAGDGECPPNTWGMGGGGGGREGKPYI